MTARTPGQSIDVTADLAIVGGGIVGLATAYRLLEARPGLRLVVLEKEAELATHQTGRNSGVVHSPNTYTPGSLKARLCGQGMAAALAFADAQGIPYDRCGELIVATTPGELPRLASIAERAHANGVDAREVGPEQMREIEPAVVGLRGLHVPATAILDWRRVALTIAAEVRARGGSILTAAEVGAIRRTSSGLVLETTAGTVAAAHVVTAAGLQSDRVAALTAPPGERPELRIVPFRGDYAVLRPAARRFCRGLIYPVADPRFPFLGVHLTRRFDGQVWAGPNAVLAFGREAYRRREVDLRELAAILAFPGFQRLARRYWRTGGAEMIRDWSRRLFVRALQRYTPDIGLDDIAWGPSGIRAQAVGRDGRLADDFVIAGGPRVLHVLNAPSPAATASLAIGRELTAMAIERFEL
ncbi:MAG TPA: L-2-hydroxyglutarate oxidase [Candidatus Limnocylindrales bacterium]